jgi:hypothetical protein
MMALLANPARTAALGVAAALAATPAGASLLDQPPRQPSFKLDDPAAASLPLLNAFRNASIERPGPMRLYLGGRYGRWTQKPWRSLTWGASDEPRVSDEAAADEAPPLEEMLGGEPFETSPSGLLEPLRMAASTPPTWLQRLDPTWTPPVLASTGPSLASNGFNVLWDPPKKPVRDWRCRRRPVQFVRYGGESDTFALVRCDGSVAPEALDRLSIMARPPDVPDPGDLLPDEPDPTAWQDLEWVPRVRVVHPRLLWVLQRVADAFPWRPIYIFSGYRPRSEPGSRRGHQSLHGEGRAMDILVMGIPNASLFRFCRTLDDVACGYYPNSKFVHIDVRRPGTGHAFWIDISGPGEPSRYVDSWPGVVERGGMTWSAGGPQTMAPSPP